MAYKFQLVQFLDYNLTAIMFLLFFALIIDLIFLIVAIQSAQVIIIFGAVLITGHSLQVNAE